VPSALWRGADGTTLVGDAALRRGLADPTRLVEDVLAAVETNGATAGSSGIDPWSLYADLVKSIVENCESKIAEPPSSVVLVHPAAWDADQCTALERVSGSLKIPAVSLIPDAVATVLANQSGTEPLEREHVLVVDVGASFKAAVVRTVG